MPREEKPAAALDATRPPLVEWNDALDAALRAGAVLTPTRRLAREIAYAADWHQRRDGAGAWAAADVASVDAFLTRCYAEAQDAGVPGADAVLLPDDTAPFAMERAAPGADLARHVKVFAAAWRTAKLHGLDSADAALRQTENGKVYARWAQAFEALLRDEGWITSAQLPARLVRLMDGNQRWRPPPAAVLEPSMGEREEDAPRRRNLTPAVRDFLTAAGCQRVELPQGTPARVTRRLAAADSAEELSLAAVWARERLSANANARIGVVLPALGAAFPIIERRFHSLFPDAPEAADYVNVSGGLALDEVPLARDALEFLACTVGADRAALRCLAQSPFLRLGLPAEGLPEYADVAALAARSHTPTLRRAAEALRAAQQRPPWQPLMARLLQIAAWPRGPLDSLEAQAKTRFDECLAAFALVERVAGFRDWAAAVAGLRRLANSRLFAPRTAAAPIQVLGRAESVGLAFDHLWLAGLGHPNGRRCRSRIRSCRWRRSAAPAWRRWRWTRNGNARAPPPRPGAAPRRTWWPATRMRKPRLRSWWRISPRRRWAMLSHGRHWQYTAIRGPLPSVWRWSIATTRPPVSWPIRDSAVAPRCWRISRCVPSAPGRATAWG